MADEFNIEQNITLNYKSNAKEASKDIDNLNSAYEAVNEEKTQGVEATKKEEQAYKSMKTQIREATQDLLKMSQTYGDTSKEAVNAAKKVADLKDQMAFASDLVDGFNPDRKFQGMATAVNVAATAATGLTAGMALFGAQNEDTEKALLKVQAAMAFSDSIGRITEMGDDFAKLKAQVVSTFTALSTAKVTDTATTEINTASKAKNIAVTEGGAVATGVLTGATTLQTVATNAATIATNIFNASLAIALAPITLIIAGVAALAAGIGYLSGAFGDFDGSAAKAEKANKKLNTEIDTLGKATEKSNKQMELSNNHAVEMARASGKSSTEVRKLKEELINQEVAEKRLNVVKAQSIFLEARRVAGLEDATDAQKETSKKAYELFKEQNGVYNNSLEARRKMALSHRVEIVQEETNRENEVLKKQQEAYKKQLEARQKAVDEARKKREEEQKAILELEKRYVNEIQGLEAKTDQEKLNLLEVNAHKEIEALKTNAEQKQRLQLLLNDKIIILQKELDDKNEKERQDKLKELLDNKALTEKQYADAQTIAEVDAIQTREQAKLDKQEEMDLLKAEQLGASLEQTTAIKAFYDEKELENTKNADDTKKEQKQAIDDALMSLTDKSFATAKMLFEKNKGIQKGILITENAIGLARVGQNTATGISKAMAKGVAGIPEAAIVGASGALSAINIIASTAKGLKALGGGSAGGDGGSSQTAPSAGNAAQVGFQSSSENQIATSVARGTNEMPPVEAFVVSSSMTSAQAIDRNRVESNSF